MTTPAKIALAAMGAVALLVTIAQPGCSPRPAPEAADPIPRLRAVSVEEREKYAGNAACATCHPQEAKDHTGSYHDRALTRVDVAGHGELFQIPTSVTDRVRDLKYTTGVVDGVCTQWVSSNGRISGIAATFGFGAGKHGITYMGYRENRLIELRLSYYPEARKWLFSPGQQERGISGGVLYPEGLAKTPDVIEECFVCHSAGLIKTENGINTDRLILGVGCETCHGPGKEHIEAVKSGSNDLKMTDLAKYRDRLTIELCGQCHRSPAGEDINDPFNKAQMPRLQGLALTQSPCFTNSGGKLSCLTCHTAHADAKETRAEYNAKCATCHNAPGGTQANCSIAPRGDCVSCHMPAQDVGMPTGLKFRNHWIKVW